MKRIAASMMELAAIMVLSGGAPGLSGRDHARDQMRRGQAVRMGVFESVREVRIEGTRSSVGQAATRRTGLEITSQLDSGPLIAITQVADESFRPGDRVRARSDGGLSRVSH